MTVPYGDPVEKRPERCCRLRFILIVFPASKTHRGPNIDRGDKFTPVDVFDASSTYFRYKFTSKYALTGGNEIPVRAKQLTAYTVQTR